MQPNLLFLSVLGCVNRGSELGNGKPKKKYHKGKLAFLAFSGVS